MAIYSSGICLAFFNSFLTAFKSVIILYIVHAFVVCKYCCRKRAFNSYLSGRRYVTSEFAIDICGRIVAAHEINLSSRTSDNGGTHQFRIFPYQLSEITHVLHISRPWRVVIVIPALFVPACIPHTLNESNIAEARQFCLFKHEE